MSQNPEGSGREPVGEPAAGAAPPAAAAPRTGHAEVDAALARLPELEDLPAADHVAVFDDVHGRLERALAELDES